MKVYYKLLLVILFTPVFSWAQSTNNQATATPAPDFFVGAAINSASFSYQGSDQLSNAKTSTSVSPQINAGTDIYFNQAQTFVFRVQLGYTENKFQLATTYSDNSYEANAGSYYEILKFNQGVASLTPQLIWNAYNGKNLKVYIDAGIGLDYDHYTNKAYSVTTYYAANTGQNTETMSFPDMHSIVFNIPLKVGIKVGGIFDIYGAYIPKTALNSDTGEAYNLSVYQVGADYFFGKR